MAKKDPSFKWNPHHKATDDIRRGGAYFNNLEGRLRRNQKSRNRAYSRSQMSSPPRANAPGSRVDVSRGGMSLAQLEKRAMRQAPSIAMGEMPLSHGAEISRGRMANQLLKGGGSIRLPQMGKQSLSQLGLPGFNMEKGAGFNLGKRGGMKAMLPLLLLALLAGGMGGGNEDLDGLLG